MSRPRILIVNSAQDSRNTYYAEPIKTLLHRSEASILHYGDVRTASDIAGYEAIIISGQPPSDDSHTKESVAENYPWIKDVEVPLFGFCGGHQIIAVSYGAHVIKDKQAEPKGYFAAYAASGHTHDSIFAGIHFGRCDVFIVYNEHKDAVSLPEDFTLLADTDRCANAFMKHRSKPIYGAQFHPEDPHYYRRSHGINQQSSQDSDTIVVNFETMVLGLTD